MVNKSENEFSFCFAVRIAHNNVSIAQQMTLKAKGDGGNAVMKTSDALIYRPSHPAHPGGEINPSPAQPSP